MSYCINCGQDYQKPSGICPRCYSDQSVPNEIIDLELSRNKISHSHSFEPDFRFPGEKTALLFSIVVSIIIAFILGAASFGLFFVILIINLIYLKMNHLIFQKNMIRVSENNFKNILSLTKVGAYRLKLPLPDIYITQDPQYNAYTMGFFRYGFIVINSSLVNEFKPNELLFIIGHEMGHMKRYHTTWLNLLSPTRAGSAQFIFAPVMQMIFNVWSVKAEHTADQGGLIACRDINSAVLCLLKLAGGPAIEKEVDLEKFMNKRDDKEEILTNLFEYLGTHPFAENRIKQLINFSSTHTAQDCKV